MSWLLGVVAIVGLNRSVKSAMDVDEIHMHGKDADTHTACLIGLLLFCIQFMVLCSIMSFPLRNGHTHRQKNIVLLLIVL